MKHGIGFLTFLFKCTIKFVPLALGVAQYF